MPDDDKTMMTTRRRKDKWIEDDGGQRVPTFDGERPAWAQVEDSRGLYGSRWRPCINTGRKQSEDALQPEGVVNATAGVGAVAWPPGHTLMTK